MRWVAAVCPGKRPRRDSELGVVPQQWPFPPNRSDDVTEYSRPAGQSPRRVVCRDDRQTQRPQRGHDRHGLETASTHSPHYRCRCGDVRCRGNHGGDRSASCDDRSCVGKPVRGDPASGCDRGVVDLRSGPRRSAPSGSHCWRLDQASTALRRCDALRETGPRDRDTTSRMRNTEAVLCPACIPPASHSSVGSQSSQSKDDRSRERVRLPLSPVPTRMLSKQGNGVEARVPSAANLLPHKWRS